MFCCSISSYSAVYFRYSLNDSPRTGRSILNAAQYEAELVMPVCYCYEGVRPSSSIPAQKEACTICVAREYNSQSSSTFWQLLRRYANTVLLNCDIVRKIISERLFSNIKNISKICLLFLIYNISIQLVLTSRYKNMLYFQTQP